MFHNLVHKNAPPSFYIELFAILANVTSLFIASRTCHGDDAIEDQHLLAIIEGNPRLKQLSFSTCTITKHLAKLHHKVTNA